jgi:hypothetical protein
MMMMMMMMSTNFNLNLSNCYFQKFGESLSRMITSLLSISLTIRPQLVFTPSWLRTSPPATLRRTGFVLSLVHMGFVVDKGVLGRAFALLMRVFPAVAT